MKKAVLPIVAVLLLILIAGCAPGPNQLKGSPDEEGETAGFWKGIWHGLIAPITFIISLFTDKVHMYEVHNTGNWYNVGYLLSIAIRLGGGGSASKRSRR